MLRSVIHVAEALEETLVDDTSRVIGLQQVIKFFGILFRYL
jgi:hypothetical protein